MPDFQSSQHDQDELYRPLCPKCGGLTALAHIQTAPQSDHDRRTFQCIACGHAEVVVLKFK
jgi:hypothetical protein